MRNELKETLPIWIQSKQSMVNQFMYKKYYNIKLRKLYRMSLKKDIEIIALRSTQMVLKWVMGWGYLLSKAHEYYYNNKCKINKRNTMEVKE